MLFRSDPLGLSVIAAASSFTVYTCGSSIITLGVSVSPVGIAVVAAVATALIIHEMGWDQDIAEGISSIADSIVNAVKNKTTVSNEELKNGVTGGSPNGDDDDDPIKKLVEKISGRYKNTKYKCQEFAKSLQNLMEENGLSGEKVTIENTIRDYLYSTKYGNISTNKIHEGIKVNDIIYDNMNPNGMNYNEWLEDLGVFETPPGILKIDLDPF